MENTPKVLFENDKPQWYVAIGDKPMGPMTAHEIYLKVEAAELTLAHYVWKPGKAGWERICDVKEFQAAVPMIPSKTTTKQLQDEVGKKPSAKKGPPAPPGASKKEQERNWFLYYNQSQFGPFSSEEIHRFIRIGKIHSAVHIWREEYDGWMKLGEVEEFVDTLKTSKPKGKPAQAKKSASERRESPRKPMVARILVSDNLSVTAAVCRDVSIGGMQVLTDRIPGPPGTQIKLNVSPAGSEKAEFEPFVAEGVVVRHLEDGRGFSFRFSKLSERARKSVETYLSRES